MNSRLLGAFGEQEAAKHLREKGYTIKSANFSTYVGEIDIIAENDNLLLFVEVKTRKEGSIVSGAEAVDGYKQKRILLTAHDYIAKTEKETEI